MFSKRIVIFLFGLALVCASLACGIFGTNEPTQEPIPTLEPTLTEEPVQGSISGVIWHEICDFIDGSPPVLGEGCVQWGEEDWEFGPNQFYDEFENGWEGVTIHLGSGPCPSTGVTTTVTNALGEYSFENLSAGTYCVSYSNLTDGNDLILIPGGPTYPFRGDDGFYYTIELGPGEDRTGVDFGYAWQFFN